MNIYQGKLTYLPDSNVFIFRDTMGYVADRWVTYPKPYAITLPKELLWWQIPPTSSVFYYTRHQAVAISIEISFGPHQYRDTTFVPTDDDIDSFIYNAQVRTSKNFILGKISYKPSRKQLFIKKGAVTILLYNILPKNFEQFRRYVDQFRFL